MEKMEEFNEYTKITMFDDVHDITDNDTDMYLKVRKGVFTVEAFPTNLDLNFASFRFDLETAKKLRDTLNTAIVLMEQGMMEE